VPDESFVGRALPTTGPFQVGREKVREFATAIGDTSPLCHDLEVARAAGHRDVLAPPTFTTTFTMPLIEAFLKDPAFGWDYTRMVHGDQRIVFHRPIVAGDELFTTIHVDSLTTRAGSHMLTLRCEVATSEEPVATTTSLLVTQA
jgi:acyl dehydratase